MAADIDFYFDFVSPYSYLANTVLPRLAAANAASINYRPIALLDLMQIVGNRPTTIECRNKFAYAQADLRRWAASYGVRLAPSARVMSIDFAELGRGALVAIAAGRGTDYVNAVFGAIWGEGRDLTQRPQLISVLDQTGFDSAELLARANSAECVAKFKTNTTAAAERGVFGSPTMFVGDAMFFGNDRFDFVTAALRAAA
jgi:2-hydroxychromene-2-carboxylate isomerase